MKKLSFIIYIWSSTILFLGLYVFLAQNSDLNDVNNYSDGVIKTSTKIFSGMILFTLFYRSSVLTIKSTIQRLSKYRSKREQIEDVEYNLIVETLLNLNTLFLNILIIIAVEWYIYLNKENYEFNLKNITIGILSSRLASLLIYAAPMIGELEVGIREIFYNLKGKFKN